MGTASPIPAQLIMVLTGPNLSLASASASATSVSDVTWPYDTRPRYNDNRVLYIFIDESVNRLKKIGLSPFILTFILNIDSIIFDVT